MDEASQLCDKIAIMINGRIICYGSPNYLLQEYGTGYQFNMTIDTSKIQLEQAKTTIKEKLPQAEFVNETILSSLEKQLDMSPTKQDEKQLIQLDYKVLNIKGINQQDKSVISPEENDIEDDCLNLSSLFSRLQELVDGENRRVLSKS